MKRLIANITSEQYQGVDWEAFKDKVRPQTFDLPYIQLDEAGDALPNFQFGRYISSYVEDCPFHLFDTKRQRNISRFELKEDICNALMRWIKCPLTCTEVMDTISRFLPSGWKEELDEIRPYVFAAMAKSPLIEDEGHFISSIEDELKAYHSMRRKSITIRPPPIRIQSILLAVRELIEEKRTPTLISRRHVLEQISLYGQYAILSHRWYQDGEELSFVDVAHFSDPTVQSKKGFKKLVGFSKVVKSFYGCRYLWVDSACINEPDRIASIPLMFAWYRHAYVCVIYLSTSSTVSKDPWSTRGWTLQELLAAERIICFTNDWKLVADYSPETPKFHVCRETSATRVDRKVSLVYNELRSVTGRIDWRAYEPGVHQAIHLFHAMGSRETTIPEDMVYSLLAALNIDIPVDYGEGFDKAFYRLQVKYLTLTADRRLLSWPGSISSPYNSMLAGSFTMPEIAAWHDPEITYPRYTKYRFNPAIYFNSNAVMRIMVSLHPLPTTLSERYVFAPMGENTFRGTYVGVLLYNLRDEDAGEALYRRVALKSCNKTEIELESKAPKWVFIR